MDFQINSILYDCNGTKSYTKGEYEKKVFYELKLNAEHGNTKAVCLT